MDFKSKGADVTNQKWPCNGSKSGLDQVCDVLLMKGKSYKLLLKSRLKELMIDATGLVVAPGW